MPKLSLHRSIVVHYGARYESHLRSFFGSENEMFADLVERSRSRFGPRVADPLREFLRCRNAFAHDQSVQKIPDVRAFVRLINQIEYQLSTSLPSFSREPLSESDLSEVEIISGARRSFEPKREKCAAASAQLPRQIHTIDGGPATTRSLRALIWGIVPIVIACLLALFRGFTKTKRQDYNTGGFWGFFQDHHHEVYQEPNFLFWIVVAGATWVFIAWIWVHFVSGGKGS